MPFSLLLLKSSTSAVVPWPSLCKEKGVCFSVLVTLPWREGSLGTNSMWGCEGRSQGRSYKSCSFLPPGLPPGLLGLLSHSTRNQETCLRGGMYFLKRLPPPLSWKHGNRKGGRQPVQLWLSDGEISMQKNGGDKWMLHQSKVLVDPVISPSFFSLCLFVSPKYQRTADTLSNSHSLK